MEVNIETVRDLQKYTVQIIETGAVILVLFVLRMIARRAIINFTLKAERYERRINLMFKHLNLATMFIFIFAMFLIWGVDLRNIGIVFSSVFAVIGIAFFAQWSILSNVTSGIVMFFTFPYKIGDYIKIHDKDFPSEGYIEDIKTFHTILHTINDEIITYPNSLMLQKGVSIIGRKDIPEVSDLPDKNMESLPHD